MAYRLQLNAARMDGLSKRLHALNPEGILARGYAIITRNEDGVVVSKVSQARGKMTARVSDGEFPLERK
jgi:exodeoxyribonuclease VII large subunit